MRKHRWRKYYAKETMFEKVMRWLGWTALLGMVFILLETYVV